MLRHRTDTSQQRNLLPLQPVRVPVTIPMLIQPPDSLRRQMTHPKLADDARTPVTPQRNHLFIIFVLIRANPNDAPNPLQRTGIRKHILPKHLQPRQTRTMRLGPILKLHPSLHRPLIATHNLAHTARIAAAANILQQQRIVQTAHVVRWKLELGRNPHPPQAAPQSMSMDGTLSKIECKRKRRDYLGARDGTFGIPEILLKRGRRLEHAEPDSFNGQ